MELLIDTLNKNISFTGDLNDAQLFVEVKSKLDRVLNGFIPAQWNDIIHVKSISDLYPIIVFYDDTDTFSTDLWHNNISTTGFNISITQPGALKVLSFGTFKILFK